MLDLADGRMATRSRTATKALAQADSVDDAPAAAGAVLHLDHGTSAHSLPEATSWGALTAKGFDQKQAAEATSWVAPQASSWGAPQASSWGAPQAPPQQHVRGTRGACPTSPLRFHTKASAVRGTARSSSGQPDELQNADSGKPDELQSAESGQPHEFQNAESGQPDELQNTESGSSDLFLPPLTYCHLLAYAPHPEGVTFEPPVKHLEPPVKHLELQLEGFALEPPINHLKPVAWVQQPGSEAVGDAAAPATGAPSQLQASALQHTPNGERPCAIHLAPLPPLGPDLKSSTSAAVPPKARCRVRSKPPQKWSFHAPPADPCIETQQCKAPSSLPPPAGLCMETVQCQATTSLPPPAGLCMETVQCQATSQRFTAELQGGVASPQLPEHAQSSAPAPASPHALLQGGVASTQLPECAQTLVPASPHLRLRAGVTSPQLLEHAQSSAPAPASPHLRPQGGVTSTQHPECAHTSVLAGPHVQPQKRRAASLSPTARAGCHDATEVSAAACMGSLREQLTGGVGSHEGAEAPAAACKRQRVAGALFDTVACWKARGLSLPGTWEGQSPGGTAVQDPVQFMHQAPASSEPALSMDKVPAGPRVVAPAVLQDEAPHRSAVLPEGAGTLEGAAGAAGVLDPTSFMCKLPAGSVVPIQGAEQSLSLIHI